jgi:transcriptional regulator with XRE-family HTH domain
MSRKMADIKNNAVERRAILLREFVASKMTVTDFAERNGMTRARMSQLLCKARNDHNE